MSIGQLLFSFQGRINRARFWLSLLLMFLVVLAVFVIERLVIPDFTDPLGRKLISVVSTILGLWVTSAVEIKRLHDLNQTGWFFLINLIPFGNIVMLVWLGVFRGTAGANSYGEDPLQRNMFERSGV